MAMLGGECSECCDVVCSSLPSRITVTFSGLPSGCPPSLRDPDIEASFGYYIGDMSRWNGCSFQAFRQAPTYRVDGTYEGCLYIAYLPTFGARGFGQCAEDSLVSVNFKSNTIVLMGGAFTLSPEPGVRLGRIPCDCELFLTNYNPLFGFASCDFSDVRVTIDTSDPDYRPLACPSRETTSCSAEDLLALEPSQSPWLASYWPTCDACDANFMSLRDSEPTVDSSVPELTANLQIGEFAIDSYAGQQFADVPPSIPGLQSMSGAYSLKFRSYANPPIYTRNSDFTNPTFSNQQVFKSLCGWFGTFYSTPYGEPDTGKGHEYVTQFGEPGREMAAIQIAVVPIGKFEPYDYSSKVFSSTRCADAKVAYQVGISCYSTPNWNSDSGFGYYKAFNYWNTSFSYYNGSPCSTLACRGKPSFTMSGTAYFTDVVIWKQGFVWYESGVSGNVSSQFTLSVS